MRSQTHTILCSPPRLSLTTPAGRAGALRCEMSTEKREILKFAESDLSRFWSKVNKEPGQGPEGKCWEWTAGRNGKKGWLYGQFWVCKKMRRAHRISWVIANGSISPDICVLHTCDNPACVNPDHLWLGTHLDNVKDREEKDRGGSASGEHHGRSKLTEVQVCEIRKRYANSSEPSQRKLAREFGVSRTVIQRIINRKIWAHLKGELK